MMTKTGHLTTVAPAVKSEARGPVARFLGVIMSPRATYAGVAANPDWLGVLLIVMAVQAIPLLWVVSTDAGRQAAVDLQLQRLEAFGATVSDAEYEGLQQTGPWAVVGRQLAVAPATALGVAGVIFALSGAVVGARRTFRQLFAVAACSTAIMALGTLFATPLNYARESLSSPTTLAAVFPFFDDTTFGGRLLGSLDLFLIWWGVNLAIGLGVLFKRRTTPIATTILGVYGVVALTIAGLRTAWTGA